MTKEEFLYLLLGASYVSYRFAKNFVIEELPPDFKYDVYLNYSSDDPSLIQFDLYPDDDNRVIENLTDKEVMELLNRNNKVPVWIDISVFKSNSDFTVFRLLCAGRYSGNPEEYYYQKRGSGPFGIKSPNHPPDYVEGVKFTLNNKAT